jgi:hypothetical protein
VISRAPSWLSWFEAVPMRTLFSFSRFSLSIFSLASCRTISACPRHKAQAACQITGPEGCVKTIMAYKTTKKYWRRWKVGCRNSQDPRAHLGDKMNTWQPTTWIDCFISLKIICFIS